MDVKGLISHTVNEDEWLFSSHRTHCNYPSPYSLVVVVFFSLSNSHASPLAAEMSSNELDETVLSAETVSAVLFDLWIYNGAISYRNLRSDKIVIFLKFGIMSICLGIGH